MKLYNTLKPIRRDLPKSFYILPTIVYYKEGKSKKLYFNFLQLCLEITLRK